MHCYNTLSSATLIATKNPFKPHLFTHYCPYTCEAVSFLVILLITMPRDTVRRHIPKISHERGHVLMADNNIPLANSIFAEKVPK
jgi:hypothetical protein